MDIRMLSLDELYELKEFVNQDISDLKNRIDSLHATKEKHNSEYLFITNKLELLYDLDAAVNKRIVDYNMKQYVFFSPQEFRHG